MEAAETGGPGIDAWCRRWFDPWLRARREVLGEQGEDPPLSCRQEERAELGPDPTSRGVVLVALRGGQVVGAAAAGVSVHGDTRVAGFRLSVPSRHRGRGAGAALWEELTSWALGQGATSVVLETLRPLGRSLDALPAAGFLRARGVTPRHLEIRRDLALPLDRALTASLTAQAVASAGGYDVRSWEGPTPVGDRDSMAGFLTAVAAALPRGGLDLVPETWDVERLAERDAHWQAEGIRWWTSVALAPDGSWAGYSMMVGACPRCSFLWQGPTFVLPEHRGRRLGLRLKLATLPLVTQAAPHLRRVVTTNGAGNSHMVAINDALGFRAVEYRDLWQGALVAGSGAGMRGTADGL